MDKLMGTENKTSFFGDDATRSLQTLMTRLHDVRNGMDELVKEAKEDFEPLAREFRDLHQEHTKRLRATLAEHGFDVDDGGSFMSKVHETVIAARSSFGDIDQSVMDAVRNGEQHVLNAFDDAINKVEDDGVCEDLTAMRNELHTCVERTRHID